MKKNKYLLLLFLLPIIMGAKKVSNEEIIGALFMEAFVSIHMSLFVLLPLSKIICPPTISSKKVFWILFAIRIIVLLTCDFMGFTAIAMIDFFGVFIGAFIFIPLLSLIAKPIRKFIMKNNKMEKQLNMFCKKCGNKLNGTETNCSVCGTKSHLIS